MAVQKFKDKIRIRVCGILEQKHELLLVQLKSPLNNELIWMPPGGGLQFGESMASCLKREFSEETGLNIVVGSFVFMNELVELPYHAIEHYFSVEQTDGDLRLGTDPELSESEQILKDIQWIPVEDLITLNVKPVWLTEWAY